MSRLRIAVVGLGMAVAPHARSLLDLADRVEVVAAYSRREARRRAFAAEYGLPVTGDLDALFADPSIAAVMLLTPPNSHLELVARAAAAGKHILLEKPLEISTERAEAIVAAARAAGVRLGVVLQNRFRPNSRKLAELVAEGRLGRLVGASARIFNWRPQSYYDEPGRGTRERDGGGVLLTQGIHTLDLLVSLAGLPVDVAAYATTTPIHRMETEDMVAAALRFAGGAMGVVSATTCAFPGFPEQIELIGTQGTAVTEGAALLARFHDGSEVRLGDATAGGGTGADPMAFAHDAHRALLADFVEAVEQGRDPAIPGRDALKAHDLIDAILQSASAGRTVTVRQR
jgi:predicted dehydrogenase